MKLSSLLLLCTGAAGVAFGDVPDSFVEYVESTNSTTYVDTGIDPSPKLTRMVVTLSPTVVNTTQYALFGRGNSWGNANSSYILLNGANFRMDWIGGQTIGPAATVGEIYTFDCCNNEATVNGTRYSSTTGKTEAYAGQPIYIFNENNNGSKLTGARMRLYACNIWRDGTTLSARYIPCVKAGVGGLYNTVDGTILYDASDKMPLAASANAHADYRVSEGVAQVRITCTKPSTGGTSDAPAEQWAGIGSTLSLTATPDSGYKTVWCVTDEDGKRTMFTGDTFDYAVTGSKDSISLSFAPESAVTTAAGLYAAIEAAKEGDTICLSAGDFVLTKTLTLDKNVKIVGAGADQTTIIAPKKADFLSIDINHDDAVLEGIALTGICFTTTPPNAVDGCHASGQWKNPFCVKVQKGTFKDSVIRDNWARLQYGTGIWLWMSGGRAENVKILDNYYDRTGNAVYGYAAYMKGDAVMENCEIARNGCPWEEQGCVHLVDSAKLLHCDVHDNDGKAANYHGGVYMWGDGVLVEGCRVYGNNNGVFIGKGVLRNSLIYANRTKLVASDASCYYAGVRQDGGTMQNCTIYSNVSPGAANGVAGLYMTNGTAENNIIYGNGGVRVTSGTFNNNLTDADAGRGTGNIIGDPAFVDAANGDFRLGVGSLARNAGKTIAAVTNDFAGVARPQGAAYDIGAYERPAATELACGIAVSQTDWKAGSVPTVTAAVEGTEDESTYQWFVDGVEIGDTSATPSLGELAVGRHSVKLVVTAGGSSVESTRTDAVCVQPLTTYVSETGSDAFPYDTEDKAAHKVADALAAVYGAADATGTVCIASGTYYLDATLVVDKPVNIVGAGRDETVLSGGKMTDTFARGMNVGNAAATVKDISFVGCTNVVRGSGVYMSAGTLDNVCIAWHRQNPNGNDERWGAGLYLTGGTVTNSVLAHNYFNASYHGTRGGGVYMTGGLVTDCDICHNWMARTQHNGLGVCMSGGTVRGCRIFDNYSTSNSTGGSGGGNVSSGHGINMSGSALVENCLIYSNGWNGVMITGGTLRNCAVFGHKQGTADYFAGINISGGSVVNCTITDNYAAGDSNGKSGLWQTGGTVVNTIIYNNGSASLGSCQISGGTFKTNITDMVASEGGFVQDPKFVNPTCDFHLQTGSPAIDKAAPLVAYDLEGTARPQRDGWDIGCYELPPSTEKSVTIASDVVEGPSGMEIAAEAKVENISGNITYKWTLTDASGAVVASDEGGEGHNVFTRKTNEAGAYVLALEVVADGVSYPAKETQAFTVRPCEVYVSQTGSDTYPYDAPEKATTNVNAALAVLWQSANATSVLHVAEGTYYLTDQLMLSTPVKVLGAGRDVSVLNGSRIPETTRGITMSHDDAVVRDLTLDGCTNQVVATGSGIRLEKGWIENVHITRIQQKNTGGHQSAVGLYMNGGTATNVVIDNCSCPSSYGNTQGIGAMVGGGLLVDSEVRDIKLNRGELHGIGVNVTGGTVRRVKITNVRGIAAKDTYGSGLYVGGGTAEDCEIRGCLQGVYIDGGTLRNSLIVGNDNNGSDKHAGGLWQGGGTVVNCTCADNETTQEDANSDFLTTAGTTVNTIAIKANVSGGTRRNNCFNESVDFKRGYRLKGTAANKATCINQGDNSVWDGIVEPLDLLGKPRIIEKIVDLGCFEYEPTGLKLIVR